MPNTNVEFTNSAPQDAEWTAHVNLLNKYTNPDRYLRMIIQYARSGKHYPADMHVDLIEQVIAARERKAEIDARIDERSRVSYEHESFSKELMKDRVVDVRKWWIETAADANDRRKIELQKQLTSTKDKS